MTRISGNRLSNYQDLNIQQVTATVNLTATSGTTRITFSKFSTIDAVVSLFLLNKTAAGTAADVYQVGTPVGNQIGLSLDGAGGMTLTIVATAMGH